MKFTYTFDQLRDIVNLWDYDNEEAPKTSWFCDSFGFVKLEEQEEENNERR